MVWTLETDRKYSSLSMLGCVYARIWFLSRHVCISHFPIENRKASIDCLEGQSKVAENFKS